MKRKPRKRQTCGRSEPYRHPYLLEPAFYPVVKHPVNRGIPLIIWDLPLFPLRISMPLPGCLRNFPLYFRSCPAPCSQGQLSLQFLVLSQAQSLFTAIVHIHSLPLPPAS